MVSVQRPLSSSRQSAGKNIKLNPKEKEIMQKRLSLFEVNHSQNNMTLSSNKRTLSKENLSRRGTKDESLVKDIETAVAQNNKEKYNSNFQTAKENSAIQLAEYNNNNSRKSLGSNSNARSSKTQLQVQLQNQNLRPELEERVFPTGAGQVVDQLD